MADKFIDSRRSVRVPLNVTLEIEGDGFKSEAKTVMVNLHGALINSPVDLPPGARVWIQVYITGKRCGARIVYRSLTDPTNYGVELDTPENVWGVSLIPETR